MKMYSRVLSLVSKKKIKKDGRSSFDVTQERFMEDTKYWWVFVRLQVVTEGRACHGVSFAHVCAESGQMPISLLHMEYREEACAGEYFTHVNVRMLDQYFEMN